MEYVEFSGKSVEEALSNAAITLGVPSDELTYEVIEEASAGFLGLFNTKPAKIKVAKKEDAVEVSSSSTPATTEVPASTSSKSSKANADYSEADVEAVVKKFLNDMFNAMNMVVNVEVKVNKAEEVVDINLTGDEMGLLIGKRGQTLDSLQYIVRLVVNKEFGGYLKVKLDTENYRERRKETLESLAKNISYKVKRSRRPVSLEPMNPYERRIIHSTLQNDKFVATKSEGEEPYRHVVVYLKKNSNRDNQ